MKNEPIKTRTIRGEISTYLIGTAGEVNQALKEEVKAEINEVLTFQKNWHEYVAKYLERDCYWDNKNTFLVLDHNGEVEVYEMSVSINPSSGKSRYTRKRKLLGCTKTRDGEVTGYVLIKKAAKYDWYQVAEELIERYKSLYATSEVVAL